MCRPDTHAFSLVAEAFHRTGAVEVWGRGTNRVIAMCEKHGAVSPTFEERQGFVIVTFKAAIVEVTEKISGAPVTAPVRAPVLRLLELLFSKGNLGNAEILAALGLKNRRRMRETYIAPAMHAALIEYTIPDKPNSRLQKYRLTSAGDKVLREQQPGRARCPHNPPHLPQIFEAMAFMKHSEF
ncbi:MAG: hypothetical protein L6406_24665 [Desulfobacterales bacterium]|nr:hypothetical protein [Desulfobacterales bacterium]